jgi:hypothetical protein
MDPAYDPVVGFARAAESMVETQRLLAQTTQRIEGTQRLGHYILAFQCVMIGLALLGLGWLVWQHTSQSAEHAAQTQALRTETQTLAAQTQALLELVRRSQH